MRTCVGCGARRPQAELVRMRRRSDGHIVFADRGGRGRSAYLCPNRACFERAQKRRSVERSLRGPRGLSMRIDTSALLPRVLDALGQTIEVSSRSGASAGPGPHKISGRGSRNDRLTVLVALHDRLTTSGEVA